MDNHINRLGKTLDHKDIFWNKPDVKTNKPRKKVIKEKN